MTAVPDNVGNPIAVIYRKQFLTGDDLLACLVITVKKTHIQVFSSADVEDMS